MSEVSLEAESGKTSTEDPQMDCEEDDKAEQNLSEELKQESVDSGSSNEDESDIMYDVDINSDEENAKSSNKEGHENDEGIRSETLAPGSVDDRGHETKHREMAETPGESGESHIETKVTFNFPLNNQPVLALPRCAFAHVAILALICCGGGGLFLV